MVGLNNGRRRRARVSGGSRSGWLRRLIAVTAATTLVGGILVATEVAAPVAPAEARFATGGSGNYGGLIDWIEWGADATPVGVGATGGSTRTIAGQQLVTTCEVDAASGSMIAYRSGNYVGDGLDDLYNIGGTGGANQLISGLANATGGGLASAHVECTTTLDGVPVPIQGLVVADAEASTAGQGEYVEATPDQSVTWRIIERLRTDGCTTSTLADLSAGGTLRLRTDGPACVQTPAGGSGPIAIAFMDGATSATLEVQGGGRSAIALGVVLGTDFGDAPASYGAAGALLAQGWAGGELSVGTTNLFGGFTLGAPTPPAVPRLGATVDSESEQQVSVDATGDGADEDGVHFASDVSVPGRLETVFVTASGPGFLNAWIDFDRNDQFDADEQIFTDEPVVAGVNTLRYTVPSDADFVAGQSFARFRITSGEGQATSPTGLSPDGEVEDYARSLFDATDAALQQCPAGTIPIPVSIIQNPSFETRTGDFQNDSANSTIGFAQHWGDSHPTGGQYHYFNPPTFDSGPPAATMPVRAGADGFGFEGGHSATVSGNSIGEGATNVLAQPLDPAATYVGFFSMAAGGYTREGNGFMQFFGTNDPNVGHYPGAGVVTPTGANTELLYSTPVVDYAGAGVTPTWQLHTFQLDASQAWPYLRVEVRNETPAANATVAGQVWMNFDDFQMFECNPTTDFGDAPASYATLLDDDGARHAIPNYDVDISTAPIMLGASIDPEDDGQPTPGADGDDTTDAADEDGVVFNPGLGYASPTLRTGVDPNTAIAVENTLEVTASADGFVSVWVDWNQDGDFLDAGEQVANAQPVTAGANDVVFAQGTNPAGISSYVRVRYSTDAASIAAPTGAAPDGEVEDYRVLFERLIQPDACVVNDSEYYAFTFSQPVSPTGTGGVGSTARYENVTVVGGVAVDMFVEVINGQLNPGDAPPNGFRVGDGTVQIGPDDARWQIITGAVIRYVFYRTGTTTPIEVNGAFTVTDVDGGEAVTFLASDLAAYAVTEGSAVTVTEPPMSVRFQGNGSWNGEPESRFQFVLEGVETFDVAWQGSTNAGFGFDGDGDLSIQPPACSDFGDAPASYGTLLADDGARHTIIPGLRLGDLIDFDPNGQPTPGADGDDDNRLADEDGVGDPIVMTVGQATQVTVSATNTTGADAVLAGWLDLDGSGGFDVGELVTVDVPAGSGTQNYVLVFPAGTATADVFARFRLFPVGDTVSPIGAATGGEVEDYPVIVLETALDIEKVSDATVDSRPGDTITYTVTAENTGTGDFTAAFPAILSDDLSGVLDDASYAADAVATIGGAPAGPVSLFGDVLVWSGPLAAGETVTLSYTVTLLSDGDGVVRNVAWGGGGDAPACDPPVGGVDPDTGVPCAESSFPLPRLTIEKSADITDLPANGGVVNYTVTVTNTGEGDYTAAAPAVVTDDLTEVLDDTSEPAGLAATIDGAPTAAPVFTSPEIVWSGALASGEVLEITYSVTYDDSTGDNILRNVACVDESETAPGAPSCDFVQIPAAGLTPWKQAEASAVPTVAGSTITYTLFFHNDGQADAAVDARDDLSHVLDDTAITSGPSSPDGLTTDLVGNFLGITGTVPPGETYTVTYTVTVLPDDERGDDIATNFLFERDDVEFPPTPGTANCTPTDVQFPDCTANEFPAIEYEKAVSVSTDPIDAGTVLTYTITVRNTGAATGNLNKVDDLSGVLDDAALTTAPSSDTPSVIVSSVSGGIFSIGGSLTSGGVAVITYEVTVLPQDQRGDDTAANFVLDPGATPPADCDPSVVPCTVTELPRIVVTKSVVASSGPVETGTQLSYTITFENQGLAAGAVDKVDDLSGVLDDADLTSGPDASDPALTVSAVVGDEFSITGTLQPGQLVTVTYEVTVRDETERGDSLAANFVLDPGGDPPTSCDPDVVPCTVTAMPELHDRKDVNPISGTPVVAGQELTYTLTFRNDGTAPGVVDRVDGLTHIVDDADLIAGPDVSDTALTASGPDAANRIAVTGTLDPGAVVTVTYTVAVRASGDRGDDVLANFMLDPLDETPVDPVCEPEPGEEPDCTINPVGEIRPLKSSDPVSGSDVAAGQRITYTLSFENVGQGAAVVDFIDYLGGVLDDADLVSGPTATGGLSASGPSGGEIQVGGSVAAGATETVTYEVVVKPYAQQGDHRLGNFLVPAGFDPPTLCDPNDPLCTLHEMNPPPPGLSLTGTTVGASVLVALMLLLVGGGLLVYRRRRWMLG